MGILNFHIYKQKLKKQRKSQDDGRGLLRVPEGGALLRVHEVQRLHRPHQRHHLKRVQGPDRQGNALQQSLQRCSGVINSLTH